MNLCTIDMKRDNLLFLFGLSSLLTTRAAAAAATLAAASPALRLELLKASLSNLPSGIALAREP